MATKWAEPGQNLSALSATTVPGLDTHVYDSAISASISGPVVSDKTASKPSKTKTQAHTTSLSVARPRGGPILPEVNNTVLARITRLTPRAASCLILAVYPPSHQPRSVEQQQPGSTRQQLQLPAAPSNSHGAASPTAIPAQAQFPGQIRAQDVRATEKDRVVLAECFRVGDVVRAAVVSLGDQRDYYLSTAGNEFGVLLAWSAAGGALMEPVSWMEMRDPISGVREKRKVAKPV